MLKLSAKNTINLTGPMNNLKLISYSIIISIMWGSLLFISVANIKTNYPLTGVIMLTYLITLPLIQTKKEKEERKKHYNKPLTSKDLKMIALRVVLFSFLIFVIIYLSSKYGDMISKTTYKGLYNAFIGIVWSWSINEAWHKRN